MNVLFDIVRCAILFIIIFDSSLSLLTLLGQSIKLTTKSLKSSEHDAEENLSRNDTTDARNSFIQTITSSSKNLLHSSRFIKDTENGLSFSILEAFDNSISNQSNLNENYSLCQECSQLRSAFLSNSFSSFACDFLYCLIRRLKTKLGDKSFEDIFDSALNLRNDIGGNTGNLLRSRDFICDTGEDLSSYILCFSSKFASLIKKITTSCISLLS